MGSTYSPRSDNLSHPIVCICHGVPSGKMRGQDDKGYPALAEYFTEAGYITIIFNFRGAGKSEGNFDMLGWTRDLNAILDFAQCKVHGWDEKNLCLLGFSAGAAVSTYVAAHNPVASSIISCACPTVSKLGSDRVLARKYIEDFRDMGIISDRNFPPSIDDWMLNFNHVYSGHWASKISPRPLLLIHGSDDSVVPVESSLQLYKSAHEPKDILIVEGAGHQLRLFDQAMKGALNWLNSHLIRD